MIIASYIFVIISLLYLVVQGCTSLFYTRKKMEFGIERMEKEWFYKKTWFGKKQLEWAKKRINQKEVVLGQKIGGVAIILFALLVLFFLLLDLFHNGFPKG